MNTQISFAFGLFVGISTGGGLKEALFVSIFTLIAMTAIRWIFLGKRAFKWNT